MSSRSLIFALCVLGFLVAFNVTSQETEDPQPSSSTDPIESSGSSEESLTRKTLRQDIATAGFYELVAWANRLGLSTKGDRATLQQRLYGHYDIPAEEQTKDAEESAEREVTIESAVESEYVTLDEIDERYVRLTGGVVLRMEDSENNAKHTVVAEEVTFNEDRNTITAYGDVHYTIERPDSTEIFTGTGLTFELGDWSGVFVEGVTERPREIEGQEIDFAFSGEFITRSEDDIIELSRGSITSSKALPPNYRIAADKIWVFGRGEWGLRNAVLYVGRVPVFYFPFFFRPGDKLFFHPTFGYRPREGNYFQTTTYILGQKEEESSPLSFLQIAEEAGDDAPPKSIDGLFLVDDPDKEVSYPSGWVLKAMLDVYTRLGVYTGLEGSFGDLWIADKLSFAVGLGISRNVYRLGTGSYTGLYESETGIEAHWNRNELFGVSLPVRYAVSGDVSIRERAYSLSGNLAAYSDTQFTADFGARAEDIDWSRVIGLSEEEEGPGSATSSYTWRLNGTVSPRLEALSPYIKSFRVSRLSGALSWRSRRVPDERLAEHVLAADNSPDASFFYPQKLSLPTFQAQLRGTPLSVPSSADRETREEQPESEIPPIRPPWPEDEEKEETEDGETVLSIPDIEEDVSGLSFQDPLSLTMSYSLRPDVSSEWLYDDESWELAEEVDWQHQYATLTGRATGSLNTDVKLYSNLLRLSSDLTVTAQLRNVFDRGPSIDETRWTALQESAYRYASRGANHAATLSTTPLPDNPLIGKSNASYTLKTLLYTRRFEEMDVDGNPVYKTETVEWSEDFVQSHQIAVNIVLRALRADQTVGITSRLPPLDPQHQGRLSAITGPLKSSVSASLEKVDDEWVKKPITISETLSLFDDLSVRQTFVFDPEESQLTSSSSSLSYDWASVAYEMKYTRGYDFIDPATGWKRRDEDELQATAASVRLRPSYELEPFWRNRVTLKAGADANWRLNLLRFTDSTFTFGSNLTVGIYDFLDLTFSSQSRNASTFIYVRPWAEGVGLEPRNVFADLLKSVNFFDREDREDSYFNVQRLSVKATHYLGDWNLNVEYSGRPEQVTDDLGRRSYEWNRELSILLQWRPIPELKSSISVDREEGILFGE